VDEIVADFGLAQISDRDALIGIIDESSPPQAVAVRAGRSSGGLVGQVMKATRGGRRRASCRRCCRRLGLD
jgi:Asp-tRNA(Asn)/Glu-tRNA(Gln) amidotransferase B subunit